MHFNSKIAESATPVMKRIESSIFHVLQTRSGEVLGSVQARGYNLNIRFRGRRECLRPGKTIVGYLCSPLACDSRSCSEYVASGRLSVNHLFKRVIGRRNARMRFRFLLESRGEPAGSLLPACCTTQRVVADGKASYWSSDDPAISSLSRTLRS